MGRQARKAVWWKVVGPWLLSPLVFAGCATTDAQKSGDGFQSLGSSSANPEPTWTDKLTAPFKASADAGAGAMNNRQATANDSDSLSISKQPDKKNPELIVAIAQMHERSGKLDEAERQYQKAIKLHPKHLGALVGYAHLQDRRSKLDEATKLYGKAIAAHPSEAAVHNDLGLCYHRRGMLQESQASLVKAVELAPDRKLYRNNLATVYVEQGQADLALGELTAAHGQAAGHYNLGYLLAKKGDPTRALAHFQQAAAYDPTMQAAHQWVAKLSPPAPANGPSFAAPVLQSQTAPRVAQRYPVIKVETAAEAQLPIAPQPGNAIRYPQTLSPQSNSLNAVPNPWAAPPSAVRYPDQQSGYSGTAAVPPTPGQSR